MPADKHLSTFDPDAPPRAKRRLRVGPAEIHDFPARDGTMLRLTRHVGGRKGPVMLVHGLGVSSLIFAIDTIQTTMLEYLCEEGYDVWMLDWRASIALPSHKAQFNADDVAINDYPAAVARVRDVTGAKDVQVVAHCVGAITLTMSLLRGLEGVRSTVLSQVSTHFHTPKLTRIKTGLHLGEFLEAIGVESLNAYVDTHGNWRDRIIDAALKVYPTQLEERCSSKVCHRNTFIYGMLYEHDQLDDATHGALHEMFGDAPITIFQHLGRLSNVKHLVAADGAEIYMDELARLAIPTAYIHGAENDTFLARSTEETYEVLSALNGAGLYKRHVIPGYGHIDCIFGKNAVHDVYPFIAAHLDAT